MRLNALVAALLLTTSSSAFAQNLDALTDALAHLPEVILTNPVPDQAYFVDTDVLRSLAGGELNPRSGLRMLVGAALRPIEAIHMGNMKNWEEKSGIAFDQIRYFAGFGTAPDTVSLWGLADAAAADDLLHALTERDFVPVGSAGALGNGEPMAIDILNRDPSDPWRSMVGAASFATAKGNVVIQAARPEVLPMLVADKPDAASNPVVATALSGLGQAVEDGQIVQAMLISPAFGLNAIDPADFMVPQSGNLDEIRAGLEASMDAGLTGIPPYLGGIIADVQLQTPAVALALAYADCDTAEGAAQQVAQRWIQSMPDTAQGHITTATAAGTDGLCAAIVSIVGDSDDPSINPIFNALFESYMRRQFTVLQIGHAP
ncbi:MAG TPA: hypothetical protein VL147_09335 [Devosia sp.]|nr:hypothetical protein [Devosia sp.]